MGLLDGLFNVGGDIVGGIFGSNAGGDEASAAQQAMANQNQTYAANSNAYQPYVDAGNTTLGQMLSGLQSGQFNTTVNPQNLVNDPGYQFRMQQGTQALQRAAASKGMLGSGAFMKGLDQYSQGLASQEYQQAFNNQFQNNQAGWSRLSGLAGLGANAVNQRAALGQNYANSMSSLYGAYGSAKAGQQQAWGNAFSSGLRDMGGTLGGMNFGGGSMGMPAAGSASGVSAADAGSGMGFGTSSLSLGDLAGAGLF